MIRIIFVAFFFVIATKSLLSIEAIGSFFETHRLVSTWVGVFLGFLIIHHITMVSITVYLHRGMTHGAVTMTKGLKGFFRFWLWIATGMVTKEWVAVHRKHHANTDKDGDPHSPIVPDPTFINFLKILLDGVSNYITAAKDKEMIAFYSKGCPDGVFTTITEHSLGRWVGFGFTIALTLFVFGENGPWVWFAMMVTTPFVAAGVINGWGHYWGYRNIDTPDNSRNIIPWGIFIGGEELHNNHHANPNKAKLSLKKFEFDIGWMWIKIFEKLHLLSIRNPA